MPPLKPVTLLNVAGTPQFRRQMDDTLPKGRSLNLSWSYPWLTNARFWRIHPAGKGVAYSQPMARINYTNISSLLTLC